MSLNKQITYFLSTILLLICGCLTLYGQSPDSLVQRQSTLSRDSVTALRMAHTPDSLVQRPMIVSKDSVVTLRNALGDTLTKTLPDSLAVTDLERDTTLIAPIDSLAIITPETDTTGINLFVEEQVKGMLEKPAFSNARDSVIEDFTNGRKLVYYFGDVTMKYGDLS